MFNILKRAAVYTGIYFIIFTITFWALTFAMITLQVFFKLFLAVFVIALAIFSFNYYKMGRTMNKLNLKTTGDKVKDIKLFTKALFA